MASKGKLENILYHEVGGLAHGTWPMVVHNRDSTMFPADLSYLHGKATIVSLCEKDKPERDGEAYRDKNLMGFSKVLLPSMALNNLVNRV